MEVSECLYCYTEFKYNKYHKRGKYCSNTCSASHKSAQHKQRWYDNEVTPERSTIRKYLTEDRGYNCELCVLGEMWNGKPITLHVDHIDGNPADSSPANTRLLCPNCHSQSPYQGNANKGRGRAAIGMSKSNNY